MFFHSIPSLFIFLPFIFLTYPLIRKFFHKVSNLYLLIFSLLFYSYDVPWFIFPLCISALSDYFLSKRLVNQIHLKNKTRVILLSTSFLINIGLLIIFKYSIFISSNFNIDFSNQIFTSIDSLLLPAGISFYTFQTLSFTIDSFKKKISIMPDFIDYFLYVSYFPQLVAGPILRPYQFFDNNSNILLNRGNYLIKTGFSRIIYGLFLKLCLADELARLNDIAYLSDFNSLGILDSWTMAFGFGMQIYYDFSAYSHMAIGISSLIGLPIKENFNFPYSSESVTEFWRRWHISLSSWVADYLYAFLNLKLPLFLYGFLPLILSWSIMGIWHGASWRFAFWGLLNGLFILIHRVFKNIIFFKENFSKSRLINKIFTLFSIMSTWIYFRSTSWEQANYLYKNLFNFKNITFNLRENYYLLVFIFFIITIIFGYFNNKKKIQIIKNNYFLQIIFTSIALTLSLIHINNQNSFIYFQF